MVRLFQCFDIFTYISMNSIRGRSLFRGPGDYRILREGYRIPDTLKGKGTEFLTPLMGGVQNSRHIIFGRGIEYLHELPKFKIYTFLTFTSFLPVTSDRRV